MVVGIPDSRWGSVVTAFIVRGESQLTEADVDQFCRDSDLLADFKRPRRAVFVETLPTNPGGKVLTRERMARFGPA